MAAHNTARSRSAPCRRGAELRTGRFLVQFLNWRPLMVVFCRLTLLCCRDVRPVLLPKLGELGSRAACEPGCGRLAAPMVAFCSLTLLCLT
jgi:hypothetical protein